MPVLKKKMFRVSVSVFLGLLLVVVYPLLANQAVKAQKVARIDPNKLAVVSAKKVQLFGHVTLVEGYHLPKYTGCHALVKLRDQPGKTVAVLTKEVRLQSLLETALSTGNLICFWGKRLLNPPNPRGGTWNVPVYVIDGVILYNMQ